MTRKRQIHEYEEEKDSNYSWMSFTDLMSALLFIFALILMISMYENQEEIEAKEEEINKVLGVKADLVEELMEAFDNSSLKMNIDAEDGSITFSSGVFFAYDSTKISKEGKENLQEFIPKYAKVILSGPFKDKISEVIIEGHTDEEGSYLYNLELSQNRAFAVTEEIFSDEFPNFSEREDLKHLITSNGRSFLEPIKNESGEVLQDESRRVEFKFRLKDEEAIEQIKGMVEEIGEN